MPRTAQWVTMTAPLRWDRGRRPLRLGTAVAGDVQAAAKCAARVRHQSLEFAAAQHARADLVGPGHVDPIREIPLVSFILANEQDSALAKARVGLRHPIHVAP
jgi:hypothetical protein